MPARATSVPRPPMRRRIAVAHVFEVTPAVGPGQVDGLAAAIGEVARIARADSKRAGGRTAITWCNCREQKQHGEHLHQDGRLHAVHGCVFYSRIVPIAGEPTGPEQDDSPVDRQAEPVYQRLLVGLLEGVVAEHWGLPACTISHLLNAHRDSSLAPRVSPVGNKD